MPTHWREVAFLSDVHLQASDPTTFAAWQRCMQGCHSDALFILGDLFEVWVGDDVLSDSAFGAFWRTCAAVMRETATRMPVYYLCGNRDFLVGPALLESAAVCGLQDPTVLNWGRARWLLSHGDALCTTDLPYQAFRQQVRQPDWQTRFLALPLPERLALAQGMRSASEAQKTQQPVWVDVDTAAALAALQQHSCSTFIHGHTHRAATHTLDAQHDRWVLSDWDALAQPPRLQLLRAVRQSESDAPRLIRENLQLF